jgi:hypothetical protein
MCSLMAASRHSTYHATGFQPLLRDFELAHLNFAAGIGLASPTLFILKRAPMLISLCASSKLAGHASAVPKFIGTVPASHMGNNEFRHLRIMPVCHGWIRSQNANYLTLPNHLSRATQSSLELKKPSVCITNIE